MAGKWYRIMTEGPTTDGREIKRDWLSQMAKNYQPTRYAARIWLEHLRGIFADGPFRAYGDVTALEARGVEGGKLGLFAQLAPHADLVTMIGAGQKLYTSAEVDENFAKTNEAYLVGLAVTDSPASIGTDRLAFSATGLHGATLPEPHIVFGDCAEIELTAADVLPPPAPGPRLADRIAAVFSRHATLTAGDLAAFRNDLETTLKLFVERFAAADAALEQRATVADLTALRTDHAALVARFDDIYKVLDMTPDQPARTPALGGPDGSVLTDY